jgi:hypothetical protein
MNDVLANDDFLNKVKVGDIVIRLATALAARV